MKPITFLVSSLAAALLVALPAAAQQAVTQCNQDIYGSAYLPADLDCTGTTGFGINLHGHGATLNLNGFAIRNAQLNAVQCWGRCSILGPGSMVGNGAGPRAVRPMTVDSVTIEGGLLGIEGFKVKMKNSTVSGAQYGVAISRSITMIDSSITGCGQYGIDVRSFFKKPCGKVVLENSSVTGNATADPCSMFNGCADITSCTSPMLDSTSSCGTSLKSDGSGSWGVCSAD